jgi:large subunit ribosomal protein L20
MRVKRGNTSRQRHKKILKRTKGFYGGLSKLIRPAKQVIVHALRNATLHRRLRKRDFRNLWVVRLNAALHQEGMSYSVFWGTKTKKEILLNRKILAELAIHEPETFKKVVEVVKG